MKVKGIIAEDFVNYREPSLMVIFPKCSFKCCTEAGNNICQNSDLANVPDYWISNETIVSLYISNPITKSIVFGGLEPFDTYSDMLSLIEKFREVTNDPIIIYTGYREDEIDLNQLQVFKNIIIKFGRFIPDDISHKDPILGIDLQSSNQYAKKIS